MKKVFLVLILCIMVFMQLPLSYTSAEAIEAIYQVYNENDNFLAEREGVEIGDKIIDKGFNEYEIYLKDDTKLIAKAKFVQTYKRPTITKKSEKQIYSRAVKKIALYMTHNDESYIIGDGTESVYGAGGIHDIANILKNSLNEYGITVELDETLHIPHNSSAYSRSAITAKKLIKNDPDAIFDIHRDGASRQYYITNVNGKNRSKIRIVLGQSNKDSAENLQFAIYLMTVAEVECPWLFQDIYWGKGHYNQALSNKALLFEMGTHTIEKEYVEESAKELAKVINKTLYDTTVDEDDDLILGGNDEETEKNENPTVNEKLDKLQETRPNVWAITIPLLLGCLIVIGGIVLYFVIYKKKKQH